MLRKILIGAAASATALVALPATASAQGYYGDGYYGRGYAGDRYYGGGYRDRYRPGDYYRGYNRGYAPRYYSRGYYDNRYYGDRYYRGRCDDGTAGAIVGGMAGALLGREIDRGGRCR